MRQFVATPARPTSAALGLMLLGIDDETDLPAWRIPGTTRGFAKQFGLQVQNGGVVGSGCTVASGGSSADVSTAQPMPAVRKTTGTSLGSTAFEHTLVEAGCLAHGFNGVWVWRAGSDITLQRFWAGATATTTLPAADTFGAFKGFGFRGSSTANDTNYALQTSTGAALDTVDTGVTRTAGNLYAGRIWTPDRGVTIRWAIQDLTAGTAPRSGSTQAAIPTTDTMFRVGMQIETRTTAARDFVFFGVNVINRAV